MKRILQFFRHARLLLALALLVFAGLGQSLPVHAGMTGHNVRQSQHAMMPMNHAAMEGMSDADRALCDLQCLALTLALPVSPVAAAPNRRMRMAVAPVVLLPVPHVSGPEGPPPKPMLL